MNDDKLEETHIEPYVVNQTVYGTLELLLFSVGGGQSATNHEN